MASPFENLRKVLRTEVQRGYDNAAIIGGLDKMIRFWEPKARKAHVEAEIIAEVVGWLERYPALAVEDRRAAMRALQQRLDEVAPAEIQRGPRGRGAPAKKGRGEPTAARATQTPPQTKRAAAPPAARPHAQAPARTQTPPTSKPRRQARKPPAPPPGLSLNSPLTAIRGIGPRQGQRLSKLGLETLQDALYFFPRRHIDYSALKPINRLRYGEDVTIIGTIQESHVRRIRGGQAQILQTVIGDGTGEIQCSWFNQPWLQDRFRPGTQIQISGRTDVYLGRLVFTNPDWEWLDRHALHTGRLVPIYNLTKGISPKNMRRWMYDAVSFGADLTSETLPDALRERATLIGLREALLAIHFPESSEELLGARRRLAFDELLLLQLGLRRQRAEWQADPGQPLPVPDDWLGAAVSALPFELTAAQQRALADVCADVAEGTPMNRLLQGDVGSGKTVVAALAVALAVCNGAQAALMAPTSILAEQHYQTIRDVLARIPNIDLGGADLPGIRLLQGSTPSSERSAIAAGLQAGSVSVLVGTHAVFQKTVEFANLALAVIDEQHRFGVAQRAALRGKGRNPHLLVMTATPIPRSLALTVYSDLDLSVIDELPPGRQPVETRVIVPQERERAYAFVRSQVEQSRQAYIICPLVEESEVVQAKAAVDEHSRLSQDVFPDLRLGLLHGKMKADEKDAVMGEFRSGALDILVSTSVIEVGVDVQNASVMLVEGANRFGLAQLHQFRGRVGRGEHQSYCLLVADAPDGYGGTAIGAIDERLKAMENTTDGFVLAEKDLELRGPGDFLGTRQSGFADLRVAQLSDVLLIDLARRVADEIFGADPHLAQPGYTLLAQQLEDFWQPGAGDVS